MRLLSGISQNKKALSRDTFLHEVLSLKPQSAFSIIFILFSFHWHNLPIITQQLWTMCCGTHGTHVFHITSSTIRNMTINAYLRLNVVAVYWLAVVVGVNMWISVLCGLLLLVLDQWLLARLDGYDTTISLRTVQCLPA